jgi:hypothetical protein
MPEKRHGTPALLPCARITSIRFKGTFSVGLQFGLRDNTPSECANKWRGLNSKLQAKMLA